MELREDGVVLSKSWTFLGAQRVEMRSRDPTTREMGPWRAYTYTVADDGTMDSYVYEDHVLLPRELYDQL